LCDGDANGDGLVDPLDVDFALARFGDDVTVGGNCQADANCNGEIDPLDAGYILGRFGTCELVEDCAVGGGDICEPHPWNDDCGDVTPLVVPPNTTVSFIGDSTGATNDCAALDAGEGILPEVWAAFTTDVTMDVLVDYCGTVTDFNFIYIVLVDSCPCDGSFIFWDPPQIQFACPPAQLNVGVLFTALPPGAYYYPILSGNIPGIEGVDGPFQINVTASLPAV